MIGRRSLLIVITTILSTILSFVALFAMTNYLGKDVFGNISWVLATLGTLNIVADLGFGSAHVKRISEGQDENDCISTYIVIKLFLIGIMVVFVFVALTVWNQIAGASITPEAWNLVVLFLLYFVMYDVATVAIFTYNARMETTKSQLITMVDPLIRVPLVIFVCVNHLTITDLAYAYVFAMLGVMIVAIFLLKRGSFRWKKPTLFRSYLKFALPISLISIAGAITLNLDKILIGYFDTPANVAYYSSAQTMLAVLAVVGSAVATVTFPSFSRLHSIGDLKSINEMTHAAERYISMICIPVTTLVLLFPTEVCVALFGSQFAPAGDTMRFLSLAVLLNVLNQVYSSQILGIDRPDITARIILGTFFLNVALLLVFVPTELLGVKMLGMAYTGAAIATAITAMTLFISVRVIVKRLTGTGSNPRILKHVLAAIAAGAVLVLLNTVYHFSGIIALIIFGAVTLAAFFAALVAMKEFTRWDVKYFLDIVNPSKMYSYMGKEMRNKK